MPRTTSSSTSGDPSQRYLSQWRKCLSSGGHRPPPDEDLLFLSTMSHRVRNCGLLESTVDECNAYHLVRKSINQVSADLGMDEGETKDFVDNMLNTYWDGLSRWRVGQGDALMSVDQRLREITNFEEAKQSQTQRTDTSRQETTNGRLAVPGTCGRK